MVGVCAIVNQGQQQVSYPKELMLPNVEYLQHSSTNTKWIEWTFFFEQKMKDSLNQQQFC